MRLNIETNSAYVEQEMSFECSNSVEQCIFQWTGKANSGADDDADVQVNGVENMPSSRCH